jgi:hypothetical protein
VAAGPVTIQLAGLHPDVRPYAEFAIQVAHANGINPTITSVRRSWANQTRLRATYERCLAEGRAGEPGECRWPANKPGDSSHQWGLSFDSWVPPEQMAAWELIRRWVGFTVPTNDVIHAEVPNWRQYRPMLIAAGQSGQ